jgi:DNA-binding NarL/FixJ family response regulator
MTGGTDNDRVTAERRLRVMVVEADALIAMDLAQTMEDSGAELVGTAATADDALALAVAATPDVAVIDLSLKGGGDGLSAANAIRRRCDAVILFITGSTSFDMVERVRAFNGSTPLFRPLRHRELPTAILRAFQEARARSGGRSHEVGESNR